MNDTKLVVAYVRVSTDEQAEGRLGLDAQIDRVTAYCKARGWTLAGVVEDAGVSAKTLDRAGMQRVLKMMNAKAVDAVVALKLDRLTRSMVDLHTLLKTADRTGVALVSVSETLDTSSAAGRLMVNMMAAIAEWERETIGERTSQALQVKRKRGERVGRHAAIGCDAGEGARDSEGAALELVRKVVLAQEGLAAVSFRCIAAQLETNGYTSRSGTRYTPSTVSSMVRRLAETDAMVKAAMETQRTIRAHRELQPRLALVQRMMAA